MEAPHPTALQRHAGLARHTLLDNLTTMCDRPKRLPFVSGQACFVPAAWGVFGTCAVQSSCPPSLHCWTRLTPRCGSHHNLPASMT
eukprot:963184-Pleurochrysis_carterae.AAC.1